MINILLQKIIKILHEKMLIVGTEQFPPGQLSSRQIPPRQLTPGQFPPRTIVPRTIPTYFLLG